MKHFVVFILVTALFGGLGLFLLNRSSRDGSLFHPLVKTGPLQLLGEKLREKGLDPQNNLEATGQTIVASISGSTVYFSSTGDLSTQVRALQLILNQTKIDKNLPKEIDLRFSKVVLRY